MRGARGHRPPRGGRLPAALLGLLAAGAIVHASARPAAADWQDEIRRLAGERGVVVAADASGRRLVDVGGDRAFVPASTLKVVTSLVALEILGPEYRFRTEFRVDDAGVLHVRGGGDPNLISEELAVIAGRLARIAPAGGFAGIRLDDSAFADDLVVPGASATSNPYDAINGALAANFNTVLVRRTGTTITSAEPQTPLTPIAIEVAREWGQTGTERVNLTRRGDRATRYAGELLAALLRERGVAVGGTIELGRAPAGTPIAYLHHQSRPLTEVLRGCLEYSNNYVANQTLLVLGLETAGEPATLAKGVAAVRSHLERRGLAAGLVLEEGSGLSRGNRATAGALLAVLDAFEPWSGLLRVDERLPVRHKTGSLNGIRTLVGYVDRAGGGQARVVVSLPGGARDRDRDRVVELLRRNL